MWQNPDDVDCFKMKKEFVFFKEYHEAIKCMSLKDQTVIIKEVLEYMFEGIMPPVHNDIKGVFWAGNYRDLRLSKTRASAKSNATQTDTKATSKQNQNDIKSTSKQNQSGLSMTYDKDKDIYKPPIVPQRGTRRAKEHKDAPDWLPDDFEKLWKWYPTGELPRPAPRGNRQRAIRAWDKLHPSPELVDTIAAALARQAATEQWQQGVGIPHLSTYLDGYGWEGWTDAEG